jgi:hypothetical protein
VVRPYPRVGDHGKLERSPHGLAYDRGLLYVSTRKRICMVDPTTRTVRVLVGARLDVGDGPSEEVRFEPSGLAVAGDVLWIAGPGSDMVRRLDLANNTLLRCLQAPLARPAAPVRGDLLRRYTVKSQKKQVTSAPARLTSRFHVWLLPLKYE